MVQFEGTGVANDAHVCKQFKPLVEGMVYRLHVPDALRDDARQEGFIGLLAAVHKYDVDSPVHFAVFARTYVKGAILRHTYTRTQMTETAAENPGIDDPTVSGIYEIEAEALIGVQLEAWMAGLSLVDAWIVRRIYWDDADTDQIAEEVGITRRRVNQRHAEILRRGSIALGEDG